MLNEPPDDQSYMTWLSNQYNALEKMRCEFLKTFIEQAQWLHNAKWIYGLYGILDGLSCSFSMLRFYFDVRFANSSFSSDVMLHDWLLTPVGIAVLIIESSAMMAFALIGNVYKKSDKKDSKWHEDLAPYWTYFRYGMKALKNGHRGVRNAIVFAEMMSIVQGARYLIMPVGIALGALSLINRPWLNKQRADRKVTEKNNRKHKAKVKALRIEIEAMSGNNLEVWETFQRNTIDPEKKLIDDSLVKQKEQAFWGYVTILSATYNGLLDAPNLYLGAVTLTLFAPALWVFITLFAFAFVCVVTRIYEEQETQRELIVSQLKLELAFKLCELALLFSKLKTVSILIFNHSGDESTLNALRAEQRELFAQLEKDLKIYEQERHALEHQCTLSFGSIVLGALCNGMDAYGALSSVLFAIATLLSLMSMAFPPLLLMACMGSGVVCLLVSVVTESHEFYKTHHAKRSNIPIDPQRLVADLQIRLTTNMDTPENICSAIDHAAHQIRGKIEKPTEQILLKSWFEVCRSFFAGGNKGLRSVDSILPSSQEIGEDGHYHDTDSMLPFAWVFAAIYSLGFSLRAIAKLGGDAASKTPKPDGGESKSPKSISTAASSSLSSFPTPPPSPPQSPTPPQSSTPPSSPLSASGFFSVTNTNFVSVDTARGSSLDHCTF